MSEKDNVYDYYEEKGDKPKESWIVRKAKQAKQFYDQNEGLCNLIGFVVIGAAGTVTGISKDISKRRSIRADYELKNLYVYDRKFGHYWKLRSPLTNRQKLTIDTAVKRGEMMGDVLERLGVLSKK